MAQPVPLRDLLPAVLQKLRPVRVTPSDRAEAGPAPRRADREGPGLSQVLLRVERLTRAA